jgi:hypothetical protein
MWFKWKKWKRKNRRTQLFCWYWKNNSINIYDLDGEIQIKKLEDFLNDEEKEVKKRLGLISLIYTDFYPEVLYENLKKLEKYKLISKN